jgi:hypothetical protein
LKKSRRRAESETLHALTIFIFILTLRPLQGKLLLNFRKNKALLQNKDVHFYGGKLYEQNRRKEGALQNERKGGENALNNSQQLRDLWKFAVE